jgi:hypothetical protein
MTNQLRGVIPFSRAYRDKGHLKIAMLCAATMLLAGCEKPGPRGGGNPVGPGQPQEVHLIWNAGQNQWKVKLNNGAEQPPTNATIVLPEGTGPTMFTVDIAGKQAAFKEPGGLTVWENSKSGTPGSTQILGPIITKQGKMVFYDLNQGAAVKIYYSLNLDNGETVDPIIDNRGGGG